MSVRVMSWVWEHSPAAGAELLVLLAIADNADDSGGNAWPSIATLARKCRMSPRTVQRAVRKLQLEAMLEVHEQAGRGGSNRYRVVVDTPRQSVTPVRLTPRQPDTAGDTSVRGGVTPVSPEPSLNHPLPPTPGKPGVCDPDNPTHDNCRGCGTNRRARERAARLRRPPWCGRCDQRTRMRGIDDDRPTRCPDCHPNAERTSA